MMRSRLACGCISATHCCVQVVERDRGERKVELAGLDLREIEQVVDERDQVPAGRVDVLQVLRGSARCRSARSAPPSSPRRKPMMALSGVRISWLIFARKSDLAADALSGLLARFGQRGFGQLAGGDLGARGFELRTRGRRGARRRRSPTHVAGSSSQTILVSSAVRRSPSPRSIVSGTGAPLPASAPLASTNRGCRGRRFRRDRQEFRGRSTGERRDWHRADGRDR